MVQPLKARLRALERAAGIGERIGLVTVETLIAAESRTDSDVMAIEVTFAGERRRLSRLPGESLDDLERRANPAGCWRAFPQPIFGAHDESDAQATAAP